MWHLLLKSMLSGLIIMAVSEIAKRSTTAGALLASLPLVSVLAMVWLWQETKDSERLAGYAQSTFWMVLPSLPMFLLLPVLLRNGVGFYLALAISCGVTIALYFLMLWLLGRFGITL
ncbi:MAG TPA: DUF3147 family protein [Rickettsiales bacterium]|nr:DUF3147 family protein [Rickettsiales bacterium]